MEDNIFDEFRKHWGNGAEMSDLEVALETARYELIVQNGLRVCDPAQCSDCKWPTHDIDTGEIINLINAAIEKFCRSAATERQP
jgi:hypothetical protein